MNWKTTENGYYGIVLLYLFLYDKMEKKNDRLLMTNLFFLGISFLFVDLGVFLLLTIYLFMRMERLQFDSLHYVINEGFSEYFAFMS